MYLLIMPNNVLSIRQNHEGLYYESVDGDTILFLIGNWHANFEFTFYWTNEWSWQTS